MTLLRHVGFWLLPVLIATVAVALVRLVDQSPVVRDISIAGRNSLAPATTSILAQFTAPLVVTAVIPRAHPARGGIEQFFAPYRRARADLDIRFVDPKDNPEQARRDGLRLGELTLATGEHRTQLGELSESGVLTALTRLQRAGSRYITFLAGNGERRIERDANHDLSGFARYLDARGLMLREVVLGRVSRIPDNTAVLVIASPQTAYAAGDLDAINAYVAAGGNLLWLWDPDAPEGMDALGAAVGVARLPGTIIDPVGLTKYRNPAYAVADHYADHITLTDFGQSVVMPYASSLLPVQNVGWATQRLMRTGDAAWTETGTLEGNVGLDTDNEVQASHTLALVLTRTHADGAEQRIAVVGDGDFIANTFVDNLGNREFGSRLVEWLARDDTLIDIHPDALADATLDLAMWQRLVVFMVFGVGLPVSLLANGALYWWRRRHA